jgi:hypothetical protein
MTAENPAEKIFLLVPKINYIWPISKAQRKFLTLSGLKGNLNNKVTFI